MRLNPIAKTNNELYVATDFTGRFFVHMKVDDLDFQASDRGYATREEAARFAAANWPTNKAPNGASIIDWDA